MKIRFSALSERDLEGIFLYINETLRNPTAAQNTISGIISLTAHLADFPKLGTVLTLPNSSNPEIRYILSSSYLILDLRRIARSRPNQLELRVV